MPWRYERAYITLQWPTISERHAFRSVPVPNELRVAPYERLPLRKRVFGHAARTVAAAGIASE